MANNNFPQLTSVTSESLQAQIRSLLPSQEGFGTDLMAQNVIVPIIDLTRAAEGSNVPQNLAQALSFGSQTAHNIANTTSTLINNAGFWYISGSVNIINVSGTQGCEFSLTDGLSSKIIFNRRVLTASPAYGSGSWAIEFTVFINAGESLVCTADAFAEFFGSSRQIADVNGNLINPAGYNPQ